MVTYEQAEAVGQQILEHESKNSWFHSVAVLKDVPAGEYYVSLRIREASLNEEPLAGRLWNDAQIMLMGPVFKIGEVTVVCETRSDVVMI